jgi:NADPH-dependent 2,4-dienoyl-CoA reductase/sulfur reductase-like enzyme
LIVGAGPAGLSAARGYRDAGGDAELVLLGAEPHHPYERPPLTKDYLRGEHGREELFMEPRGRYRELGIDLRLRHAAAELDPGAGVVVTEQGEQLRFGACVLATGSAPKRLPVPGGDGGHLLTIREMESSERLQSQAAAGTTATVVGSGFIGCEAAASLAMRGCEVTLVSDEDAPHATHLGDEVGAILASWLAEAGVALHMGAGVDSFSADGRSVSVGGQDVVSDVTVVAVGVEPRVGLAERAGLDVEDGRVRTDASMRTSAESVLAAGDVALAFNPPAGRRLPVEHWGEALSQGEVAGRTLAGEDARWEQAPGFWSTIGTRTLKYVAWGDGHDEVRLDAGDDGSFTAWYGQDGTVVGVLCHERDHDYERGRELVESGAPLR